MAVSVCTCSIRAVRNPLMAEYSAPSVNTTCHIAYRALIAVSCFLFALSVFYFKRTCWRCGQLWPYVRMGSLGTHWKWYCNAMCDAAKITPCVPNTCAQNAIFSLLIRHIIRSRQIHVAIDNPSLVPSITRLTSSSNFWNYLCVADDVSHTESLQSNSCWGFSHLYISKM
jgi:hypothetical protein